MDLRGHHSAHSNQLKMCILLVHRTLVGHTDWEYWLAPGVWGTGSEGLICCYILSTLVSFEFCTVYIALLIIKHICLSTLNRHIKRYKDVIAMVSFSPNGKIFLL